MKLNLGCGHNQLQGWVNVDSAPACQPDQVADLETFPWPWADSSVEEVMFNHSLEHMGAETKVFLKLMQELYRICAPGARIRIGVPHPRSDFFIGDPTHVRIITPDILKLFDRQLNDEWKRTGIANTPLAHYLDVDFQVVGSRLILMPPYGDQLDRGEISHEELTRLVRTQNNIAGEWRIEMVARK